MAPLTESLPFLSAFRQQLISVTHPPTTCILQQSLALPVCEILFFRKPGWQFWPPGFPPTLLLAYFQSQSSLDDKFLILLMQPVCRPLFYWQQSYPRRKNVRPCTYFIYRELLTSSLSFPTMTFLFSGASAMLMTHELPYEFCCPNYGGNFWLFRCRWLGSFGSYIKSYRRS